MIATYDRKQNLLKINQKKNKQEDKAMQKAIENTTSIGTHLKSQTPPFLFTFELFNYNVHNYLVDSRVLSNVMPHSVCKTINVLPSK